MQASRMPYGEVSEYGLAVKEEKDVGLRVRITKHSSIARAENSY